MEPNRDSAAIAAREACEAYRSTTAPLLRDVAQFLEWMADAMDDSDDIAGALAGSGLANVLPLLPKNVRDVFMEYLADEAAAGVRADTAYLARPKGAS